VAEGGKPLQSMPPQAAQQPAGPRDPQPPSDADALRVELARREAALRQALRELSQARSQLSEALSQRDERSGAAALANAEWARLGAETAELHARIGHLTRRAPEPLLTPFTVARLSEASRKLRCPRCAGAMTEYTFHVVRADKCDECYGIFFDNGELEVVIADTLEIRDEQWQHFGDLFRRSP